MQRARRERYLEHLKSGMNFTQAAQAVGVSKRTGKVWRNGRTRSGGRDERASVDRYSGGMDEPKKVDGYHLSQDERIEIADMLRQGRSLRQIAARLGRSPSTISREVRGNTGPTGEYGPHRAQQTGSVRLRRPKPAKIASNPALRAIVRGKLDARWSPEQISGWLRGEFPDNGGMRVCHETIYRAIYVQARGELRRDVAKCLRTGRAKRRPQGDTASRRPRFREPMAMVSERPAEVADRAVPGHREGDLICGAASRSAIGALVERTTRFCILPRLPDGHGAEQVQQAIIRKMGRLPEPVRNSLTWDQGAELALHEGITAALDMDVYFCDPHSPWQRGTNESTNGLLRRYFPKGTDLSVYPEAYLDAVAEELNDRPRKTLGFKKPSEEFVRLIEAAA